MSALFGFFQRDSVPGPAGLLAAMAKRLNTENQSEVRAEEGQGFGFGRISRVQDSGTGPVWNEDRTLCLSVAGEIYDAGHLRKSLVDQGHAFRTTSDCEVALHLYEEVGEEFVRSLNGAFVLAIWDERKTRLLLATDRLGLHPLYYAQTSERFLFASGVRALLCDPSLDRRLDPLAMAQMLTFEYPLGDRTLLQQVSLLAPASILTLSNGQSRIRSYWDLHFEDTYSSRSEDSYLEELGHLLNQAVKRQYSAGKAGILLSGGLDSRVVLAFLARERSEAHDLYSFTFGIPGCSDAKIAAELSQVARTRHQFQALRPDYLVDTAPRGIQLTDGLESVVHMHALANLDSQARCVDELYKGFLGDALTGGHLALDLWGSYGDETTRFMFNRHAVLFSEAEQRSLFSDEYFRQIPDTVFGSFKEVFAQSRSELMANRHNYYDVRQRQRRFILNGVQLVRSRVIVRTPFCDKDLVEFMLRVPPGLRLGRSLVKRLLARDFPRLAKVPCTDTGFPLVNCRRDLLIRAEQQLRWRLRSAGLGWLKTPSRVPYADYAGWFRTSLKSWVEELLLDGRTLGRGYFKASYIRDLVASHMRGDNHAAKLGMLITLELAQRCLLEAAAAPVSRQPDAGQLLRSV